MKRKTGFFGIGPWLAVVGFVFFINAAIISIDHRKDFYMTVFGGTADSNLGLLLFLFGFLVFFAAQISFYIGWRRGNLVTAGLYRLCRHPMYASWILIMLPATGLMLHSWLVMINAAVVYVMFKLLIDREDKRLETAFGREYLDYRARTNEIVPWVRRGAKAGWRGQ